MTTPDPGKVADLDAARVARMARVDPPQPTVPDLATCACGSVWFQPHAMTINATSGLPIDFAFPVKCVECGQETSHA